MSAEPEIWKPIPGYEGAYEVSDLGRVRSLPRYVYFTRKGADIMHPVGGRILKQAYHRDGYRMVRLAKDGHLGTSLVHRLVAMCFVDNPENKREVDHIDGDKTSNRARNLRWVTRSENMLNAVFHGTMNQPDNRGERHGLARLTEPEIVKMRSLWPAFSHREIGEMFGISREHARDIVNKKAWRHVA